MKCPHCGVRIPNEDIIKKLPKTLIVKAAGAIGGKKTAQRGPEYFRELQARRKTRSGGRPRKDA